MPWPHARSKPALTYARLQIAVISLAHLKRTGRA